MLKVILIKRAAIYNHLLFTDEINIKSINRKVTHLKRITGISMTITF